MDKAALQDSLSRHTVMTFSRSGGAGGQNINKVNTKVHAAIATNDIGGLTDQEREQVRLHLRNVINKEDVLCISVQDERFQERNREIALARLEKMITTASRIPAKRKRTKPTKAARERRLRFKKLRSTVKKNRSRTDY